VSDPETTVIAYVASPAVVAIHILFYPVQNQKKGNELKSSKNIETFSRKYRNKNCKR